MNIHLFSIDFKLIFIVSIIFVFLLPIVVMFNKKKALIYSYLLVYLLLLFIGVFFDITINYRTVTIDILITNNWFSNMPIIANFSPLGILINLILLFPLGVTLPLLSKKVTSYKIIIIGILSSLIIEILQFSLPIKRYPELLDIINNTISVILGYIYYFCINKLIGGSNNGRVSKQKSSN